MYRLGSKDLDIGPGRDARRAAVRGGYLPVDPLAAALGALKIERCWQWGKKGACAMTVPTPELIPTRRHHETR